MTGGDRIISGLHPAGVQAAEVGLLDPLRIILRGAGWSDDAHGKECCGKHGAEGFHGRKGARDGRRGKEPFTAAGSGHRREPLRQVAGADVAAGQDGGDEAAAKLVAVIHHRSETCGAGRFEHETQLFVRQAHRGKQ